VRIIVGPALCQLCGRKVWFTDKREWIDRDGIAHKYGCQRKAA
jgi:hypothetical protein